MQMISATFFNTIDLSGDECNGVAFARLSDPLPTGTLVNIALRAVDSGENKACQQFPFLWNSEDEKKPVQLNLFCEILGGPHKGQGWYQNLRLPASLQDKLGKSITDGARKGCYIDAHILRDIYNAARGVPLTSTDGLNSVKIAGYVNAVVCVRVKLSEYTNRNGELVRKQSIDSVVDPTDPRCARITQAGELDPQGYPVTAVAPAPAPAPAAPAAPAPMAYAPPASYAVPAPTAYAAPTAYSAPAVTATANSAIGPNSGDDEIPF